MAWGAGALAAVLLVVLGVWLFGGSGDLASAERGPEGTRDLEERPEEIPAGMVVEGADEVAGRIARGPTGWTAAASYRATGARDDVESVIEVGAGDEFARRQATFDDRRKVIVYDGSDGSVLTVTLDDDGSGEIRVTAVRVRS